jgi:Icc protein
MRIAHVSDLHLLEPDVGLRSALERLRLFYLSAYRPLGAAGRISRFRRALESAQASGFDHLVITGDLTEDGKPAQFEEVARVLAESRIAPERVTLIPGNHDAYEDRGSWTRALEGPLRPWAATSGRAPGKVIDLGEAALLPVSTSVHQHWASSFGHIDDEQFDALERRSSDPGLSRKAIVVVQHHAPHPYRFGPMQWLDGLREHARLLALLARRATVQVLHGHLHYAITRVLGPAGIVRVFGAPAVVQSKAPSVRYYETSGGVIVPA